MEECHCDPRVPDAYRYTPLHYACKGNGNIDTVRFLIVDKHCDPACRGRWGKTPLHCACRSGKLDIVRFLVVDQHCDPACVEKKGGTPLHYACLSGKLDILLGFLLLTSIVIQHVLRRRVELHCTMPV